MKTILAVSSIALGAAAFASTNADQKSCSSTCGASPRAALASNAAESDIVATAVEAGNFKTLAAALGAADLVEALQGEGPFTVFAPTDAAFAKIDEDTMKKLLDPKNKRMLAGILTFHVVPGNLTAKTIVENKIETATTLNGQRLDVRIDEGAVFVDGAKVTATDIKCSNGVIHVIDSVVMPVSGSLVDVAVEAKSFGTLIAAAKAAGLADNLAKKGPYTVFAPTDEAFRKLPEGTVESLLKPENKDQLVAILNHHIVEGRVYADQAMKIDEAPTLNGDKLPVSITDEKAMIGGANIVKTDIEASNGVIHVIDTVLIP